jgi:hypothetical protein
MSNFVVGDRVQRGDGDTGEITGGTITIIIPPKRMKTNNYWSLSQLEKDEMTTYAHIKWDDGQEAVIDVDVLDREDSQMEREFRTKAVEISKEIDQKLRVASTALREAVEISEKHGIPFHANISSLRQGYTPESLYTLFPKIDKEFINTLTDVFNEYDGHVGWQHSRVCY